MFYTVSINITHSTQPLNIDINYHVYILNDKNQHFPIKSDRYIPPLIRLIL